MAVHVIYARKSTESDDRQVLSIDSQIQELKALAMRRGIEVGEVIKESRSAKAPGRPLFGSLMKRITSGEIASVLCWKMDRLARNHFDTGQILQALADGDLPRVVTPEREYTADGNDRFLGGFELGISTKFIDDLRQNVRRGNRARLQLGWPNYRPPIGYLEDRSGPTTTIVDDPARFPLVRRMWDELLSGRLNPKQITDWADRQGLRTRRTAVRGGKPLTFQYVYRMFANPFYMGLIRLSTGETHRGAYRPMVTAAEFDHAQEILGRPGRSHHVRHKFAYAGLLKCGLCGRSLVPELHVKRSGRRFVYYRCRGRVDGRACPSPSLPERAFEQQLETDLRRATLPREAVSWILDNIRGDLRSTLAQHAAGRAGLEKALAESRRESDALLTLRLREQVDDDAFESRRLGLLDQQAKLRLRLQEPAPDPEALMARIESVLAFSASLPRSFQEGDAVRRRQILNTVCANPIVRDRKALYTAKEPFAFFESSGRVRQWCTTVELMRTWILKHNFQLPPLFTEYEEKEERRRRAGVLARRKQRGRVQES